jgi:hypothetical protein
MQFSNVIVNNLTNVFNIFILKVDLFLALGSQAINYYRYGTKKDCSGKWDDFKFCLKTKTKSSEIADVSFT